MNNPPVRLPETFTSPLHEYVILMRKKNCLCKTSDRTGQFLITVYNYNNLVCLFLLIFILFFCFGANKSSASTQTSHGV